MQIRRSYRHSLLAAGMVGALALGGVTACSDEDGDGAVTDEEVGEIDDGAEDAGDELEQEIDEGNEEAE